MSDFLTLFKYEFKLQFPFKRKGQKIDLVGSLSSLLISALIIAVVILLVSTIANNYVLVEINKIPDPTARTLELMNVFYLAIILVMTGAGVERMRKSLSEKKDKEIFLRLPVKPQTIFLSKIAVLVIMNYIMAALLIIPTNVIFYIALKPDYLYWIRTAIVFLALPFVPLFLSSLLIIPYIKSINFLKDKYAVIFVLFTAVLVGAFLLYTLFLGVVQTLLETGSIRFLFNANFTYVLQMLLKFGYPANSLASIVLGVDTLKSVLIVLAVLVLAVSMVYVITNKLFYITLYKNEERHFKNKKIETYKEKNPLFALMKREFITVFREPKNLFSYFAISLAMPIMVYCCYSLFESLIYNTIGLNIDFSLALLIILIFSVLTNTFCSTNISRDGVAFLKIKSLPVKASKVLISKVLFCSIVSSIAVVLSSALLMIITNLKPVDGIVCMILGIVFSLAQILIATRMDLNHAKLSLSSIEVERESSKTIAKVVFIGLIIALIVGLLSIVISVFTMGNTTDTIGNLKLIPAYAYIVPAIICMLYAGGSFAYYFVNLERKYTNFVA